MAAKRTTMKISLLRKTPSAVLTMALLVGVVLYLARCQHETSPAAPEMALNPPEHFPALEIPDNNQPSRERIALGRRLYYDSILGNGGLACASCHWQKQGFTSPRPEGQPPILPHVNLAWKQTFMWHGSKSGPLEAVMRFEVKDFMGSNLQLLRDHPHYPSLFAQAYGTDSITLDVVAKALAQFLRSMISADSKYDRVMAGKAQFTPVEKQGWQIFNSAQAACFHCHSPPLFTDNALHNTGVDTQYSQAIHRGHFNVSGDSADLGQFVSPTLRNVALRERYLHDGRMSQLRQVVAFYNSGITINPWIDPVMVKASGSPDLELNPKEVDALTAFLYTLTDTTFTISPKFSAPLP